MSKVKWTIVFLMMFMCASCAAGPNPLLGSESSDAGFFLGLWHGLIIFFTLIGSLFTDNVGIYEVHNAGGWYDVGFYFGLSISVGSTTIFSSRRKKEN